MDINWFKDKRVTVFGLGLLGGGVGTVKFLVKHGARVIVTDIKTREQLVSSLEKLKGLKNIEYVLGQHRQEDFIKVDMVIKTPPAPWDNKHVKLALEKNIPVEMDSSLFFKLCRNPIIGVTGTKGKTTTASIIYQILKAAGKDPIKVGVGEASVLDKIDILKKESVPVFELSSWRLSALGREKLSPPIAVIKNILPDHMNYYKTIEDYVADKKNIFLNQKNKDWLVINGDDEIVSEAAKDAPSQIIKFSYSPVKKGKSVFFEEGNIYLNNGVDIKKIAAVGDLKIPGRHNISNVMAAAGAALAFGINSEHIREGIVGFNGIPHRLEFVAEKNEVKYYNDTSATIPHSAISAINSFKQPIVLIVGGTDKNLDFADLAGEIKEKVKDCIFLKGDATEKLITEIKKNLPEEEKDREFVVTDSMDEAVLLASRKAESGDVILLSPGAASFGLFLNEFDRGNKFREEVLKLE